MRLRLSTSAGIGGFVFLLPAGLILLAIVVFPLVFSIVASFFDVELLNLGFRNFVGLRNYLAAFGDRNFLVSLGNTVVFVLVVVSLECVAGLLLAALAMAPVPGVAVLRVSFLLPTVLAPIVVGLMWRYMLFKGHGVLSYLLALLGLEPETGILGSITLSQLAVFLTDIWEWSGFMAMIFVAGMMGIAAELYEAARVDGASRLQIFRRITLPMLRPAILIALIIRSMDAFCVYDIIYAITRGGPGLSTTSVSYQIYRTAIRNNELGYGSALSWIVTVIVLLLSLAYIRVAYRRQEL